MKIKKRHLLNYSILIPYLILSVLGLIIVYSTTSATLIQAGANPFRSVLNQGVFWVLSLIAILFIYNLRLDFLKNGKVLSAAMIVEFILLLASRFFPAVNGAHGWIVLGPVSFQPAEYLKIIMVWMLAYFFDQMQGEVGIYDYQAIFKGRLFPQVFHDWRVYFTILIVMVMTLPDLGNATIIVLTSIIIFCVSGVAFRWFSTLLVTIIVGSGTFLGLIGLIGVETFSKVPLFGYVARRFKAYFNPFLDATDSGLQMTHSYYAMSNGGWFGRGLGNSIEKEGYLREAQTDFVFSVVIEELGFVGASLILALLFFLVLRMIMVGIKAKDAFNSILAMGLAAFLLMQTFVNIGGISGIIPSTGVTFPFLSQGGNSLLVISIAVAVVLNIDANERRQAIYQEAEQAYYQEADGYSN
ncbi:cell division peptidoglycan polymerase FtsW [Streptococcus caprae]|uniref:Probable peptidoglycan glycosyltransferase FtsW n=1 Tax=Streptococcus caprae TaxID=1640501 RepID=A0ABV8CWB7_9STRE